MPKVTEALQNFLRARKATHNGPDLLERWTPFMETQVNVSAGTGEPVPDKKQTWTDGTTDWWHIRIPKNARTTPEFRDYNMSWPLDLHAEAIGSTGWDWSARKSRWVGFDFDAIVGHAEGIGISDQELERVRLAAQALPYVEVRKSTGGNGIHLYVYFDDAGVPTENHVEHAALARAVLGKMSTETGFDFATQIDACGQVLWIWHRKATVENQGLKRIKAAECELSISDLPINWRDHIEVVNRRRTKIRIEGITGEVQSLFDSLASARRVVALDDKHKAVIDALGRSGYSTIWVSDHHLLQTHTCALDKLMEEKSTDLGLKGFFKTNSNGRNPGEPNCFGFPLENGGWKMYRFSPGINEHDTWRQDKEGWTTCYFNCAPDLNVAATAMGGVEDAEKGGYLFETASKALKAASALGQTIHLPSKMMDREARLSAHKDGRLVMQILKRDGDEGMIGWLGKKDKWIRVFNAQASPRKDDNDYAEYDALVRQVTTPAKEDAGWYLRNPRGEWERFPTEKIKLALLSLNNTKAEADQILGSAMHKRWRLVNSPFKDEYPGDRQWNLDAAQYRFQPANLTDDEMPRHPHWDRILKHCGQDLDSAIKQNEWCQRNNIKSGAEYILAWIAIMLRDPFHPLPYLFMYGDQNSGKSILHRAIGLLMTKGVASADRALTNANEFNGELANCVLAYIEEKDLSKAGATAYGRIKEWVDGSTLWIRKMRTDSYSQANTLHFIQCANFREFCPVFPGDKRIIVIFVPSLQPGEEIDRTTLISKLEEEAPHFMRTIMDFTLPSVEGRLWLPVINTSNKESAELASHNVLEMFINEQVFAAPGEIVEFQTFFSKFQESVSPEERYEWTKQKVIRSLPQNFAYGAYTDNKRMIGNISFDKPGDPKAKPFVVHAGRLMLKKD